MKNILFYCSLNGKTQFLQVEHEIVSDKIRESKYNLLKWLTDNYFGTFNFLDAICSKFFSSIEILYRILLRALVNISYCSLYISSFSSNWVFKSLHLKEDNIHLSLKCFIFHIRPYYKMYGWVVENYELTEKCRKISSKWTRGPQGCYSLVSNRLPPRFSDKDTSVNDEVIGKGQFGAVKFALLHKLGVNVVAKVRDKNSSPKVSLLKL